MKHKSADPPIGSRSHYTRSRERFQTSRPVPGLFDPESGEKAKDAL